MKRLGMTATAGAAKLLFPSFSRSGAQVSGHASLGTRRRAAAGGLGGMHKHHAGVAATAAALALFLSMPSDAGAATTASAAFSNVQFSVLDLTPDDGVAARVEFGPRVSDFRAQYLGSGTAVVQQHSPHFPVPVLAQAQSGERMAHASSSGALGDMDTMAASGPVLFEHDIVEAGGFQEVRVLVGAHSEFIVSGQGDLAVITDTPFDSMIQGRSSLRVSMEYDSIGGPFQSWGEFLELKQEYTHLGFSDTFSFGAVNDNPFDIELRLRFETSSTVAYGPLPVPEPSTWLMLAAGLLAVGLRTRRDKP